jgi:hypothetical protein
MILFMKYLFWRSDKPNVKELNDEKSTGKTTSLTTKSIESKDDPNLTNKFNLNNKLTASSSSKVSKIFFETDV